MKGYWHSAKFALIIIVWCSVHICSSSKIVALLDYTENKVSVNCDLCADQWLFIISTGRSGSTSIFSMLNLIPGIFISGENDGVVNTMLTLRNSLIRQEKMGKLQDAWAHPKIDSHGILCTLQLYTKQILGTYNTSSVRIIGFKEIRHVNSEQLNFFRELFPCARFIINTRQDLQAQAKSGFYKRNRHSLTALKNDTKNILQWASSVAENKKTLFYLPTERFNIATFNRLLQWIGVRDCQYTGIHHSHSKNSFHPDNREDVLSGRANCSFVFEKNR